MPRLGREGLEGLAGVGAPCRLPAVRMVAETIREYLWGILNAVIARATNALGESLNARIQALKRRAGSYRNRARFRNAIYFYLFYLGGLDLYPTGARAVHSNPISPGNWSPWGYRTARAKLG